MLTASALVLSLTAIFGLGFLIPILFHARRWATDAALACGLTGSLVATGICGGIAFKLLPPLPNGTIILTQWLPVGPIAELRWDVQVDMLAAFFGFLTAAFSALVAIYSFAALRAAHFHGQRSRIVSAFNLFVWSTLLVVLVSNGFALLVALEMMTLAFGYLTLYKHTYYEIEEHATAATEEQRKNARLAPQVYLIVSHTSTAFLLVAVSLLALHSGSLSFAVWNVQANQLGPTLSAAIFLLALAGLGIRAGLTPAHFWVALVHPASPTPTHALSLGIAIKVAVYLMYRFFFQFLRPQPAWGYVVLLLAAITALVNVWYAIASHDLKTALAYHSIENIGIIVAPIGAAMILLGAGQAEAGRWLATLALVASLYHTLNHAAFKGLLYMATGAIDNLTGGIVELNRLGGLIKLYPWTSAAFLCGAFAIAGLPPLNGFISEWLTLQALLQGMTALRANDPLGALVLVGGLVLLMVSFALTAFCFYKLVGLALLGLPRTPAYEREEWQKSEAGRPMLAVMGLLAAVCLALGLLPGQVAPWLSGLVTSLGYGETLTRPAWQGLALQPQVLADKPALPVAGLLGVVGLLLLFPALLRPGRSVRRPTLPWNCGAPFDSATMQPTSASLSDQIRHLLPHASQPPRDARAFLPARFMLSASRVYPQTVYEVFRGAYNRGIGWLLVNSERLGRALQGGDIRHYLGYIFVANLLALVLFLLLGLVAS